MQEDSLRKSSVKLYRLENEMREEVKNFLKNYFD